MINRIRHVIRLALISLALIAPAVKATRELDQATLLNLEEL